MKKITRKKTADNEDESVIHRDITKNEHKNYWDKFDNVI